MNDRHRRHFLVSSVTVEKDIIISPKKVAYIKDF